jgi:hypothetical protein
MNKLVFRSVVVLALLGAACAQTSGAPPATNAATAASAPLDGRLFVVEGRDVPPGAPSKIELSFAGGMLDSSACREKGLPPVAYTAAADGTFHAERRAGDTIDTWAGRVTGDRMDGVFTSTRAGAVTMRIPFEGRAR